MSGLSREEAIKFLTEILKMEIPSDLLYTSTKPDLIFLNKIIQAFQAEIPFQSVSLIAVDIPFRHRPTWPEIKEAMFAKHGGLCYSMNGFMWFLLKAIGYDVSVAHVTVKLGPKPHTPDDHIVIFVHNLVKEGDLYLVEVGFGTPSYEAVSLDFANESPVYRQSYLVFKYIKDGNRLLRMHRTRGSGEAKPGGNNDSVDRFKEAYELRIESSRNFEDFDKCYDPLYRDPEAVSFHKSLRSVHFPGGKTFAILHEKTLTENEAGNLDEQPIGDDDAILKCYMSHFPQYGEDLLKNAIKNWRIATTEAKQ